ncbi:MAG: flagellar motor protein MotB, partial [Chitinophagaceae bacterium]
MAAANKKYETYSYFDAIDIYEKVARKGYQSPELFKKLGNAYYFNSDFKKAAEWYGSLFRIDTARIEPEYYYRYAQTLKSFGNPDRANEYMDKFTQAASNDRRAVMYAAHKDYFEIIRHNSGRFNIRNAGFNSPFSDFGTAFLKDRLIFTTARDTGGPISRKMKWTNQAFTQLYATTAKVDGTFSQPEPFSVNLNSK